MHICLQGFNIATLNIFNHKRISISISKVQTTSMYIMSNM